MPPEEPDGDRHQHPRRTLESSAGTTIGAPHHEPAVVTNMIGRTANQVTLNDSVGSDARALPDGWRAQILDLAPQGAAVVRERGAFAKPHEGHTIFLVGLDMDSRIVHPESWRSREAADLQHASSAHLPAAVAGNSRPRRCQSSHGASGTRTAIVRRIDRELADYRRHADPGAGRRWSRRGRRGRVGALRRRCPDVSYSRGAIARPREPGRRPPTRVADAWVHGGDSCPSRMPSATSVRSARHVPPRERRGDPEALGQIRSRRTKKVLAVPVPLLSGGCSSRAGLRQRGLPSGPRHRSRRAWQRDAWLLLDGESPAAVRWRSGCSRCCSHSPSQRGRPGTTHAAIRASATRHETSRRRRRRRGDGAAPAPGSRSARSFRGRARAQRPRRRASVRRGGILGPGIEARGRPARAPARESRRLYPSWVRGLFARARRRRASECGVLESRSEAPSSAVSPASAPGSRRSQSSSISERSKSAKRR